VDRNWGFTDTYDQKYSGDRKNGEPIRWIQPAKNISWKERLIDFFESVGPTASNFVKR
jgi:hypothetical protein